MAIVRDMATKQGRGRGSFVAGLLAQVGDFYGDVLEAITPWSPRPPKLPKPGGLTDAPGLAGDDSDDVPDPGSVIER